MPIETEIKLKIPDERTAERIMDDSFIAGRICDAFMARQMKAVYYDTADHALQQKKWSLRLRDEGGIKIAALKIMGTSENGLFSREEWQCRAESIETGIVKLAGEGAPLEIMELRGLQERCRIEFERKSAAVKFPDGSAAELAIDTGVIFAEDKSEPLQELELELLCGTPEQMLELAGMLESEYGLSRELSGKYARALRLLRSR